MCWTLALLAGITGCKGDEREEILVNLTNEIKASRTTIGDIRTELEEAAKGKDGKLNTDSVKKVKDLIQKLKGDDKGNENRESFVSKIVAQSSKSQKFAQKKSEEDKDEFAKRNKKNLDDLSREIGELSEEGLKLKEALQKIREMDPGVAREIEEDLRDLMGRLELIGQRK